MNVIRDSRSPNLENLAPYYLALHIAGGHVGLPALVSTFLFAKSVSRHPTLINFCITWTIYSISYCIRLYDRRHDPSPQGLACKVQAVMIHGAPPMAVVSGLFVVIQVWRALNEAPQQSAGPRWPRTAGLIVALMLPYIAFFAFALPSLVLAEKYPSSVNASNGLYCTINKEPFRRFGVPMFCSIVLVLIIGFEIAIGIRYLRSWSRIAKAFPLAERKTSPSMCFRVGIFNLYSVVTLSAGIFFLSARPSPWPYMVQAALPLAAVLVFGTQKDLFIAWCFWKRKRKPTCRKINSMPSGLSYKPTVIDIITPSPSLTPTSSQWSIAQC